jgi:hypothetical protein
MNINYNDFGTLSLARINTNSTQTTVDNFYTLLLSALQNSMTVTTTTPVPKTDSSGDDLLVFYQDANNPVYTYTPNTGKYPVATFRIFFNTPSDCTNFPLHFSMSWFDDSRIIVTSVDTPSVVGKFDVSNLDQSAFNIFIYGILGVALPAAMDQISNFVYNNVEVDV